MNPIDVHIGSRVRARREELGLELGELASRLDASAAKLEAIEAGQERLGAATLMRLAGVLGVDAAYLFKSDDLTAASQNVAFEPTEHVLQAVKLNKAFASIEDRARREDILQHVEAAAELDRLSRTED